MKKYMHMTRVEEKLRSIKIRDKVDVKYFICRFSMNFLVLVS